MHRSFNILEHFEQVQTIGAVATKEYSMLKAMEKMEHEWQGLEFKVMAYKDTGEDQWGGWGTSGLERGQVQSMHAWLCVGAG